MLQREPMRVAGRAVGCGHRCGEPRRPAIEKGVHVGRPEAIADRLRARRVGTCEEPIVETVKRDLGAPQLLLDPLVAVETQLDSLVNS